jgi:hypothetical protein
MFVEEFHDACEQLLPQVGPRLGRAINFRVDQVLSHSMALTMTSAWAPGSASRSWKLSPAKEPSP